jgi:hypothetical protein
MDTDMDMINIIKDIKIKDKDLKVIQMNIKVIMIIIIIIIKDILKTKMKMMLKN